PADAGDLHRSPDLRAVPGRSVFSPLGPVWRGERMMNQSTIARAGIGLLILAVLFPMAYGDTYFLSVGVLALLYAYLALSWNILGGIAGQLSLGHAAYFGIGAYTSTWLFANLGLTPWLGMFAGAALAIVAAVVIGAASFKLRGAYYALATLAAA